VDEFFAGVAGGADDSDGGGIDIVGLHCKGRARERRGLG
jgi:hypothetical protein